MPNEIKPEILPPETGLVKVWRWRVRPTTATFIRVGAAISAITAAGYFFQNFLQLRGVVNVIASQVDLAFVALCVFVAGCAVTIGLPRKRMWRIIIGIAVVMAALGIDRLTPKPPIQPTIASLPTQPIPVTKSPTAEEIAKEIAKNIPTPPETRKKIAVPADSEPPIEVVSHPYDIDADRRKKFLALVKPGDEEHDILRIGCMTSSESSCVAAGKFLLLFSEAGWTIDSDRVFRAEPTIPKDGVTLISHLDKEPPKQPPHLGTWQLMSSIQIKISKALMRVGIPSSGSGQLDMPIGTLGVYFGPEPGPQTIELQLMLSNCEPTFESCDILATSTETHGSFVTNGNASQLVHAKRPRQVVFQPDTSDKQFRVDESELPKKLTLGRCGGGKVCRLIIRKFTKDGIVLDSRGAVIIGDSGKLQSVLVNWSTTER
jgi:hypothetical protein